MRVDGVGAAVDLLDVGMVGGLGQDARDDAALPRHAQAEFGAELLDARRSVSGEAAMRPLRTS